MDYSATFARHFARLVSLLMHEDGSVDEQKASLRALVTVSKSGSIAFAAEDLRLRANDQAVPGALTGVHDVAAQMAAHSIRKICIAAGASAADLLGTARILASRPALGDGGANARQKLAALGATAIEFVVIAPEPERVESLSEAVTVVSPLASDTATAGAITDAAAQLLKQLSAPDISKVTPEELFAALRTATTIDASTKVLDDLVLLAEYSVRAGKPLVVADVFHGVVTRETSLADVETKRAYVLAIRRLSKPAILRAIAALISRRPERKQTCYEVLARAGEDGADAVIEQITQAPTTDDRRALFEVLGELGDAVPALIRMLGDSRWFVVRNAADLLGEMIATSSEEALIGVLKHSDDRVRRSATTALLRLGTPNALKAVYDAVHDTSPEVRMQAAVAIASKKDMKTSQTLIRAIENEQDGDVQLALIAALGKVATPEAVQKLVKMAEPEGRLFRKKTTNFRVAAVQALGEAKTPAAYAALKELTADKEREVRDTAARALAHAGR